MAARKPVRKGVPATLFVPGIVITPPSTISCEACGVKHDIGAELPIVEPARMKHFNNAVETFVAEHRPCFQKEGECTSNEK